MATSQSGACNALSTALEACCSDAVSCNDLFANHCIEPYRDTHEEQRDAVLRHLLNGLCILHRQVPSCKSFARCVASTMHLSYDVCTLLLSAHTQKQVTLNTFHLCCASIGLNMNGSDYGRYLSHKLQQRLTRWGPLYACEDALSVVSCVESLGSGSLLELASLHNVDPGVNTSNKDHLRDVIIHHLVSGECRDADAVLCASVRSVLMPSAESCAGTDPRPFILDAVVNFGVKKTIQRTLRCVGISSHSTDTLRSMLVQHCDTLHERVRYTFQIRCQRLAATNSPCRIVHDSRTATTVRPGLCRLSALRLIQLSMYPAHRSPPIPATLRSPVWIRVEGL